MSRENADKKSSDMAQTARARSNLYGFLAVIYRTAPTAELLRQVKEPPLRAALSRAGVTLSQDFLDQPEEKLLGDLALEYTRLFIGPGKHVSPHESVYISGGEGFLWGEATADVKRFIESLGVEFQSDYLGMPDHVSIELEFMQAVTHREGQAWNEQDRKMVTHCLQIENQFVDEHLTRWIPQFCKKVMDTAEMPFYKDIARLTRDSIESEKEQIAEWCTEWIKNIPTTTATQTAVLLANARSQ